MKKGWQTKKLGDLCATIQDGAHESPQRQFDSPGKGRFLYITSKNIRNNCLDLGNVSYVEEDFHNRIYQRCKPNVGDVLLTKDGANTGNVTLNTLDEPFSLLSSVCLIKTKPDALRPGFLSYYIQSPAGLKSITGQMTGAAIKRIILRDIKLAPISLPPLPEQHRIVGILDEAFDGLATAKANAEKNLQNARALFESYLHAIFTKCREGWVEKQLGDVCEYINGKAHEQCIDQNGLFIVINSKFISSEGEVFKKSKRALLLLRSGDIAMVLSDVPNGKALAKCYLVEKPNTYTLNQRICVIRSTQFHTKFLFYQLNRHRHFLAIDNGENQTNMRLNQVLSCSLFLPPISEQESIAAQLDAMSEATQRLESIYQ